MNEEILKDDPLKKPKKITVAMVVSVMALLMVCAFASFHWICADYFNYKANESDAHKQLDEMRTRYAEEESARLAEHKRRSDELDEALKKKKADIAALLRGYLERFDAKTNDFELTIAGKHAELTGKQAELVEIKRMISILPDVRGQLLSASNSLEAARAQRDSALKDERAAQETYGKWNAKIEVAKAQLDELNERKGVIGRELDALAQETNAVHLTMASLRGQRKTLEAEIETERIKLRNTEGDVKTVTAQLKGVKDQIEVEETKRKTAEVARTKAETALNVALDKKREAESARDKALSEAQQAESRWATRKPEIEGLIKDMERILEMKSNAVKSAEDKKEGGANK